MKIETEHEEKKPATRVAPLSEERKDEVYEFWHDDPVMKRFMLIFHSLVTEGVSRAQAARTAHLILALSAGMPGGLDLNPAKVAS